MALPGVRRKAVETPGHALRASLAYGMVLVACLGLSPAIQAIPLPRMLQWTEASADTVYYVPFTGSLKSVRVDRAPVTMHAWLEAPARKVMEIAVDILSGRPDTGLAHVVIAWMPSGQGWMWLEQRDRDLHLHLASTSDRARLRGHSVWLRHIMPMTAGEPVTVRLVVRPFSYRIAVVTHAGPVVREVGMSPGDGWRLITPAEREWGLGTKLLTAGWMAALLWPLGYLASVQSRAALVVAAAGTGVGLLLLPIVSGCAWLPGLGWCGAAAGLLGGSRSGALAAWLLRPRA
jgi:hypothetical protein